MDNVRETDAGSRFVCSEPERACFEAGVKMATIYHQFMGTPFSSKNKAELERTIENCIRTQPYVSNAKVKIVAEGGDKADQYTYTSLTGNMIDAVVIIVIGRTEVTAEMRYDSELKYPLMFISSMRPV